MAADQAEPVDKALLLNSKVAIANGLTPTGRKLGVRMDDPLGYPLYSIKYVDGKAGGIVEELTGRWTTLTSCNNDLTAYLSKLWAFSDSKTQQEAKPLYAKSEPNAAVQ